MLAEKTFQLLLLLLLVLLPRCLSKLGSPDSLEACLKFHTEDYCKDPDNVPPAGDRILFDCLEVYTPDECLARPSKVAAPTCSDKSFVNEMRSLAVTFRQFMGRAMLNESVANATSVNLVLNVPKHILPELDSVASAFEPVPVLLAARKIRSSVLLSLGDNRNETLMARLLPWMQIGVVAGLSALVGLCLGWILRGMQAKEVTQQVSSTSTTSSSSSSRRGDHPADTLHRQQQQNVEMAHGYFRLGMRHVFFLSSVLVYMLFFAFLFTVFQNYKGQYDRNIAQFQIAQELPPAGCSVETSNWWSSLKGMVVDRENKCVQWRVSRGRAEGYQMWQALSDINYLSGLTQTFLEFVFSPLQIFLRTLGQSISAFLAELPWDLRILAPIVSPLAMIIIGIFLILNKLLSRGGSISFGVTGISIGGARPSIVGPPGAHPGFLISDTSTTSNSNTKRLTGSDPRHRRGPSQRLLTVDDRERDRGSPRSSDDDGERSDEARAGSSAHRKRKSHKKHKSRQRDRSKPGSTRALASAAEREPDDAGEGSAVEADSELTDREQKSSSTSTAVVRSPAKQKGNKSGKHSLESPTAQAASADDHDSAFGNSGSSAQFVGSSVTVTELVEEEADESKRGES